MSADAGYHRPDQSKIQQLNDIANKLRIHSIESTNASKSGHPTSCSSMAEIMSVLFFHTMRYKVSDPRDASSDRFVLSKGHSAPILYAAWAEAGLFPASDLLKLRKIDCDLEGHPTPRLSFVDVATGSLGQGLSCAAGMAYVGKNYDKASYRVYTLMGDGESMEGSVWEAAAFASYYKLDNLVAIIDVNRLGQSQPTSLQHQMEVYKARMEAFGWNAIVLDGHDVEALCRAFYDASVVKGKPTCIVAKTYKGKGINGIENLENWHGKALGDKAAKAIEEIKAHIKNQGPHGLSPQPVIDDAPDVSLKAKLIEPPNYELGQKIATRETYGNALVKLYKTCPRVIALDGDTKNSTHSLKLMKANNDNYIECFIAEQNLIGVAVGCGTRHRTIPFASTFACFLTRGFDQIRMAAISQANVKFCGSHCGVSIGEDGPSQMALEDLSMFRSVYGSYVFYPSDAVSMERAVELSANTEGICFIRSSRPATPVIYKNDEVFEIGKSKVVKKSDNDKVLIIGAAITLVHAMEAAEELAKSGINARVLDPFTIKPLDNEGIIANAKAAGGKIITVEDHYPEGGIGDAVCSAVSADSSIVVHKLAVNGLPRSGPSAALLDMFGISSKHIVALAKKILA
ncbi:transketolase-like [Xenia sp. Carnegie-2017]|uniref:transketolase-like n=1 Tax=Xenia sp. Carnegie-2017 TaxID=2897299 RepID=UPI001F039E2B|nr:transketolase-like [Xenia sp. Carnegie-2017]